MGAALHLRDRVRRIDAYAAHRRQVDHHPGLADRPAGPVVAPAAYGYRQTVTARREQRPLHVAGVRATGHHGGPMVDCAIPYRPRVVVAVVAELPYGAAQSTP